MLNQPSNLLSKNESGKGGYVYFLSNGRRTMLYIGVTSKLKGRMDDHKNGFGSNYTKKYNLTDLMLYEKYGSIEDAIRREKQLKNWHKEWKWNLIKESNPELKDLYWEL